RDLQLQPFTPDQNLTKPQVPSPFRSIKHQRTHRTRSERTKATSTRAHKTRRAPQSNETSPQSKADVSVSHSLPVWQRSMQPCDSSKPANTSSFPITHTAAPHVSSIAYSRTTT